MLQLQEADLPSLFNEFFSKVVVLREELDKEESDAIIVLESCERLVATLAFATRLVESELMNLEREDEPA